MSFKITLKEKPSPHFMETKPRYEVMVGDRKVDELYFNVTGYVGALMTVQGARVALPEGGISTYRRVAAQLNREAKEIEAEMASDAAELVSVEGTVDPHICKLRFTDGVEIFAASREYRAATELYGRSGVRRAFFEPQDAPEVRIDERPLKDRDFVLTTFRTEVPTRLAFAIGRLPRGLREADLARPLQKAVSDDKIAEMVERIAFIDDDALEIAGIEHDEGAVIEASRLPGGGYLSTAGPIFAERVTSTRGWPKILIPDERIEDYEKVMGRLCYRFGTEPEMSCAAGLEA